MYKLPDGEVWMRAIEKRDLAFLSKLRNTPETWLRLDAVNFLNQANQLEWWKNISISDTEAYYIISKQGAFGHEDIGIIRTDEIDHKNQSIRVGCDIDVNYRGMGYGKETYRLLFDFCFRQLNMNRVWLLVLQDNIPAIALYTKMGMTSEGIMRQAVFRDGVFKDYVIMSILRNEYEKNGGSSNLHS